MTRKEMEQCRSLPKEIKSIEMSMRKPKQTDVVVFYKDYRTGKGIPKARREVDNGEEELRILRSNLNACKRKLMKRLHEAEKYIESIDDSRTRAIFRMYYLGGMSQKDIADQLNFTPARICQLINSFWFDNPGRT